MLIRVVTVGSRMPRWVTQAVDEYTARFPSDWRVEWREVRAEQRSPSGQPAVWMAREAQRLMQAVPSGARLLALDERGVDLTTRDLALRIARVRDDGASLALLIGGPDGLDPGLKARCHERIRLSSLTLAHPVVRVVLAEQLYRAWSLLVGHPYHRD